MLSTLEVAYAKAHEDAGAGRHAGYAAEMLALSRTLTELLPHEPGALAIAALIHFAEARRPARLDPDGAMTPLSEQDPALWRAPLIEAAQAWLARALANGRLEPRVLQAAIHGAWCARRSLAEPAPWPQVLGLYDALLAVRDDTVVRLNRAAALAEVAGAQAGLDAVDGLRGAGLSAFAPYHALRADLLRRLGRGDEAGAAYAAVLALEPGPAERLWLERRMATLSPQPPRSPRSPRRRTGRRGGSG